MKTQKKLRKTETLEDIVFEGRNKSYGAFELNQKRSKYLLIAFLISFLSLTTAIAVPFIKSFKNGRIINVIHRGTEIKLVNIPKVEIPLPPPPPMPPDIKNLEDQLSYIAPVIVEKAAETDLLPINADIMNQRNKPMDPLIDYVEPGPAVIEEPIEVIFTNPQESATFMGGNLNEFRNWVAKNISYPPEAAEAGIFGKVFIEFCVDSIGEVVDVKILRKLHPAIDDITMKVIRSSPKWRPAKQGGNPVKQRFTIPFIFEMQ